jgi:hypothetical protein
MKVWQTGVYPGSSVKFYVVAYAERSCVGLNFGRESTVKIINLTGDRAPTVTAGRLNVTGVYVTKSYEPTLEILAPKVGLGGERENLDHNQRR